MQRILEPFYRLRLTLGLIALLAISQCSRAQDFPPVSPNIQNFASGSYVIPMDNDKQALNGEPFNLSAYGLVYTLLENGIPLNWVIKSGKAKDEIDFSATASRIYPTTTAAALLDFRAGAFIIDSQYVNEIVSCGGTSNLHVDALIQGYGNQVAVYRLTQDVSVDVHYELSNAPVVAVLDDGGFAQTGYALLAYAGIPYDLIDYATFEQNNACYTFITQPHLSANNVNTAYVGIVSNFVNGGGNFLAQCASINAYESNANFLSTNGFTYASQTALGPNLTYSNNDMPVMQFQGNVYGYGVGSVSYFTLNTGSLQPYAYPGVWRNVNGSPGHILAAGDINGAALGGNVFYLAGHNYTPQQTITSNGGNNSFQSNVIETYNINRMVLNAVFVPGNWVATCVSADRCICPGQAVNIGCSDGGNTTYNWSPASGLSCTNCPNPLAAPSATTTYTATGLNRCSSSSVTVYVDCPTVTIEDDTVCVGDCATIAITADLTYATDSLFIDGVGQPFTNSVQLCPSTTTGYLFTITDVQGNAFSDSVYVVVHPVFHPSITPSGLHCAGDIVTFTTSGLTSPVWTSAATLSCTSCSVPSVTLANSFTVGVSGSDSNGCPADTSISYTVYPLPVLVPTSDEVCAGETATLSVSGASTYAWSGFTTTTSSLSFIPPATVSIPVTGTSINGCVSQTTVGVVVNPIIQLVIDDVVYKCITDSCVTLHSANASDVAWYESNGSFISNSGSIVVCPDVSTTYIVQTNDQGCYLPDSVDVAIVQLPTIVAMNDTMVCPFSTVQLTATGGVSYVWSNNGNVLSGQSPTITAVSNEVYHVEGESAEGCFNHDEVSVGIYPQPIANFTVSAPQGFISLLPINFTSTSTDAVCWNWTFNDDTYNNATTEDATHAYTTPGDHAVSLAVCNEYGCWDTIVGAVHLTSEFFYYVPNAFTPNNDSDNPVFKVEGTNIDTENFELVIYNRWGEQIYALHSPDEVWMGNYRSDKGYYVEDGVYMWRMHLQDKYTKLKYDAEGHVMLVR